ncbi:hypothetical protein AWJ20_2617 [Sugiyamaella lignohabitans]|uniref:Transcription regulator Rua1 C-terminal domain-containing protein n=1 Tax=Sugiyamaella lignohabitans TaxID=796027 RepID=A0A167F9M2_9ASCO|nr:uncharacterized protein AWJ20_2617 [Sugiyamaella lignohabitans]ANB14998.1 hypothetical protein AWJ20_2617 [Sugiyamaella lignohabitans]
MLQTSSYQAGESSSFDAVKENDFKGYGYDYQGITKSHPEEQYGCGQLLDQSKEGSIFACSESIGKIDEPIVKIEEDENAFTLLDFCNDEGEANITPSVHPFNEIFKFLDNGSKPADDWTCENNENFSGSCHSPVFLKKEHDINEDYEPKRSALEEIVGSGGSSSLQNRRTLSQALTDSTTHGTASSSTLHHTSNLTATTRYKQEIGGRSKNQRKNNGRNKRQDYEVDDDDADYEEEDDADEYGEEEDDDDDEYNEEEEHRQSSRRSYSNSKMKNKQISTFSYARPSRLGYTKPSPALKAQVGYIKPCRVEKPSLLSDVSTKAPKPYLEQTMVENCPSPTSPLEFVPLDIKQKGKSRKDGKIGIVVGKRTYRLSGDQLLLLTKLMQIDFEPVNVMLPKSKRFIKEPLNVAPEYLVRTRQSDMMVEQYGIPFESIKSRELFFCLPPKETYTINGESYLGAEPTETLYDPVFIRRLPSDEDNHGWCEVCGKWLQLRNHTYAHHFKSVHGISQRTKSTVTLPKVIRGQAGNDKKMQGYCEPCQCWIDLHHRRNGQRWQTWYIHQFQVHHKDQKPNETQRPIPGVNSPVSRLFSGYLG